MTFFLYTQTKHLRQKSQDETYTDTHTHQNQQVNNGRRLICTVISLRMIVRWWAYLTTMKTNEKLTIYDVLFIRDTFHHVVRSVLNPMLTNHNRKRCKIIKVNQIQGCWNVSVWLFRILLGTGIMISNRENERSKWCYLFV